MFHTKLMVDKEELYRCISSKHFLHSTQCEENTLKIYNLYFYWAHVCVISSESLFIIIKKLIHKKATWTAWWHLLPYMRCLQNMRNTETTSEDLWDIFTPHKRSDWPSKIFRHTYHFDPREENLRASAASHRYKKWVKKSLCSLIRLGKVVFYL